VERLPLLLLPGLDGTGLLFRALRAHLPEEVAPVCESLPPDPRLGYRDLASGLHPPDVPYAVLGESFSGPLALLLADRDPNVRAVILAASFARRPAGALSWLWPLVRSPLFRARLPDAVLRRFLLGEDAAALDLAAFRMAGRFVEPAVMAARLRAVGRVDVERELGRCRVPVLYLRARRDRLVGPEVAERVRRVNPRVEVEALDAPHLVLQRAPEEAGRRIGEFLRRHEVIARHAASR